MRSFRHPGTVLTDHVFTVPLDHGNPAGPQIEVFAREVAAAAKAGARQPWLVFLQGGPGAASPRPVGRESWLDRALEDYRVLLLDQRGTGRSTPATRQTLAGLGSARAQADYLANFRADSDHQGRRDHPPHADRRRAVDRARPELRRLLRDHLPVARTGRAARGADHRRGAGAGGHGRGCLPRHLPAGRGQDGRALRALPGRCRARQAGRQAPAQARRAGCPTGPR